MPFSIAARHSVKTRITLPLLKTNTSLGRLLNGGIIATGVDGTISASTLGR